MDITMAYYAFIGGCSVLSAALLTVMSCKIMQILQLSSYRVRGVFDWFKSTKADYMIRYFSVAFFSCICMFVYVGCFGKYPYVSYLGLLFYLLHAVTFIVTTLRQKNKTPLRFTPRVIRLTVLTAVLCCGASFGLLYIEKFLPIRYGLIGVLPLCVPFIVFAAHYILWPFETLNNARYVRKARKKLQSAPKLIKIGITGSYGKTTAKNILAAMLAPSYNVLYTPGSYNTPLGVARVVNGELQASHDVFIAEMGARYRGDIAELCKLVSPDIGVVTAVGNQHLATFGSVEAIAATKYELVEGLTREGYAAFSADNAVTRQMYDRAPCKKDLAGSASDAAASVTYSDVSFGPKGTRFMLRHDGQEVRVVTKLLGRHVPTLVSLCAAVALRLGVPLAKIAAAAESLEPVEHRLQCIPGGDVTVLDDAYNSNTEGAVIALEVLRSFDGTKIIITPGLVELGEEEQTANFALGREVVGCADYAYFVGNRAETLKKGALDGGMAEERIFVCATLDEAVEKSSGIAGKKTILFENDLPDNL